MAASSRVIRNAHQEVLAWAGHRLGTTFREPCIAIGVMDKDGHLAGAVVFNDHGLRNVEMSMVGRFHLQAVREVFAYAFNELGCRRISVTIRARNRDMLRLAHKWGWVTEGVKRNYYDNDDAIILGMLREACRFLRG